jgi:ABC-type antimicrobial peptide transport system permease subunit
MIAVAAAILAHTMITSVQRRRRDYALLESLGFVRRQVSASVATQATSFAIVSVMIGIPLGLLIGRSVWAEIADQLAVPSEPTTNTIGVVLIVPGVILLANVVAAIPAWVARGTRPAEELRAE